MADRTLGPTYGWAVGETITVYERDIRNAQTGSAITTAAVDSDSTVTFTGLASDTKFIATDGTYAVRFGTLTDPDTGGGGGISQEDLDDAISTHASDTTSVHGITNTAVLATADDVASDVTAHNNDETGVHGIPNTQVTVGSCIFTGGNWTFDGATISARPTWPAPLIWQLGDASSNSPSAWMLPGDVWYPEQE